MKTNEEIISEIFKRSIDELKMLGFQKESVEMIMKTIILPLHKALQAKDEKFLSDFKFVSDKAAEAHRQEKIELVESVPYKEYAHQSLFCPKCTIKFWKQEQLTQLQNDPNE